MKGVSQYSPAEMLGIIDKDMIACYNYRLIQEEHHGRKFGGKNPSQKIKEKLTEKAKASVDSGFASKLAPCLVKYKDSTDSNIYFVSWDTTQEQQKNYRCSCANWEWSGIHCLHIRCAQLLANDSDEMCDKPKPAGKAIIPSQRIRSDLPRQKKNTSKSQHYGAVLKSKAVGYKEQTKTMTTTEETHFNDVSSRGRKIVRKFNVADL